MFRAILCLLCAINLYSQPLKWLDSGLKIVSSLELQNFKEGYGIAINEGLVLTAASLVYGETKIKDIMLYDSQPPTQAIYCLSHAEILALDTNLDLAILKPQKFTDIYCNILPESNLRSLNFKKKSFDIFNNVYLGSFYSQLEIEYFLEQEWSNFALKQSTLENLENFPQDKKQEMIGMPLFAKDGFIGILRDDGSILRQPEIVSFICKVSQTTSIFDSYLTLQKYCK